MARRRNAANGNGHHAPEPQTQQKRGNGVDSEQAKAIFDRLDNLHTEFESVAGAFRADCKEVYEEAANNLGVPRKILRKQYILHRGAKKLAEWEANLESEEKDKLDLLRVALGTDFIGTPLGNAAMEAAGADGLS